MGNNFIFKTDHQAVNQQKIQIFILLLEPLKFTNLFPKKRNLSFSNSPFYL